MALTVALTRAKDTNNTARFQETSVATGEPKSSARSAFRNGLGLAWVTPTPLR
jgi:hypothetical protein